MSRRSSVVAGCIATLLILFCITAVAIAVAFNTAGVRLAGRTNSYLTQATAPPTIAWPTPTLASPLTAVSTPVPDDAPRSLDQIQIDLHVLPQPRTYTADQVFAERLERGETADGQTAYYIEYDEAGFNAYMQTWLAATNSRQANRLQNVWFDLKPGGVMIYADVDLVIGWQRLGALFMLDESGRQFSFQGVDIAGQLLSTAPTGEIANAVNQLENSANEALRDLTFLDATGALTIQQITISETGAQILAH
jgi:hypothetical protein